MIISDNDAAGVQPQNSLPAWRPFVRAAMRKAAKKEAQRRGNKGNEPAFNYRWEHVVAVVDLARKLARLTGADEEVVEAAAWLHDVAKNKGGSHPEAGAKYARKKLPQTDFPPEKIEAVAVAIEKHMGLWRKKPLKNLEAAVLWDADKLAKLGLTAVMHWTGLKLARGPVQLKQMLADGHQDWQRRTVASMHTEPARRAAAARLARYNQFWTNLAAELEAADLTTEDL